MFFFKGCDVSLAQWIINWAIRTETCFKTFSHFKVSLHKLAPLSGVLQLLLKYIVFYEKLKLLSCWQENFFASIMLKQLYLSGSLTDTLKTDSKECVIMSEIDVCVQSQGRKSTYFRLWTPAVFSCFFLLLLSGVSTADNLALCPPIPSIFLSQIKPLHVSTSMNLLRGFPPFLLPGSSVFVTLHSINSMSLIPNLLISSHFLLYFDSWTQYFIFPSWTLFCFGNFFQVFQ